MIHFISRRASKIITKDHFLALTLFILVLFGIVGCSANTGTETGMPAESTQPPTLEPTREVEVEEIVQSPEAEGQQFAPPCTISLWHSFDENEIGSLLEVSSIFSEAHPEVEFDFLYTPNYDIKKKFEDAASIGGGPALLVGSSGWGPSFFNHGLIQDISGLIDQEIIENIKPAALGSVEYTEALIGLPLNVYGVLLYRNSEIIRQAPESFEELISAAQTGTSGDQVGAFLDYGLFYSGGHLEAIGGDLMDSDGTPMFNDDRGVRWAEMLKRFPDAGPVVQNGDDDLNLFIEGRVGFMIDVLDNASLLTEAIGEDQLNIDPWPAELSGYVQSDPIFLNSNLAEQDITCVVAFMEFLLSEQAQASFADPSMANFVPAVHGLIITDPLQSQASAAFESGVAYPILPEMSAYWEPLNNALFSIVELDAEPNEALEIAEDLINTNLTDSDEE